MVKKCKYCGKEITRTDREVFCSQECAYTYKNHKLHCGRMIIRIAAKYDFDIKNFDKIVNAKMLLTPDNPKRCPCDIDNPKRYCGSAQCIADTVYQGHCHCNLFWSKTVDNADDK